MKISTYGIKARGKRNTFNPHLTKSDTIKITRLNITMLLTQNKEKPCLESKSLKKRTVKVKMLNSGEITFFHCKNQINLANWVKDIQFTEHTYRNCHKQKTTESLDHN